MDQRLTELEIRYTHQAELLSELSSVLYEQQRTIVKLEARLKELERRLAEEGPQGGVPNEPPPHY